MHPHDLLAERDPRRTEDERDSRRGRNRGRHSHASRTRSRRRRRHARSKPSGRNCRRGSRPKYQRGLKPRSPRSTRLSIPALESVARQFYPQASLVPRITAGGTDAAFFRRAGTVAYGFGLFSPTLSAGEFASRFHGNNERIDVASLSLTTEAWLALADRW